MYWLRSSFDISSITDLEVLARIYTDVQGELSVLDSNNEKIAKVEWMESPFTELISKSIKYPCKIVSRLVGPETVVAVSPKIKKIDPSSFDHSNKDCLLEWANHIDTKLSAEMNRTNDMGYSFKSPTKKLDIDELIMAARLSKHATNVFIGTYGIIASNPECVYLSWFPSSEQGESYSSLMFDKDDGLASPFCDVIAEDFEYMNECFNKWKSANYVGNLSDYCDKYSNHFM